MSTFFNINDIRVVDRRHDVVIIQCDEAEIDEAVYLSDQCSIKLYRCDELRCSCHEFCVYSLFNDLYLLFRAKDFLFVFLQFLRDVTFRVCQSLFADPFGRHLVFVCVRDLEIIPENIVESYFQRAYSCRLHLTALYINKVIFARA